MSREPIIDELLTKARFWELFQEAVADQSVGPWWHHAVFVVDRPEGGYLTVPLPLRQDLFIELHRVEAARQQGEEVPQEAFGFYDLVTGLGDFLRLCDASQIEPLLRMHPFIAGQRPTADAPDLVSSYGHLVFDLMCRVFRVHPSIVQPPGGLPIGPHQQAYYNDTIKDLRDHFADGLSEAARDLTKGRVRRLSTKPEAEKKRRQRRRRRLAPPS